MADVKPTRNPWMVALTVTWVVLLLLSISLFALAVYTASLTYDQPGLPPSDVLANIYFIISGGLFVIALIVFAVQLGVGAVRWYLDPASRYVEPAPVIVDPTVGK